MRQLGRLFGNLWAWFLNQWKTRVWPWYRRQDRKVQFGIAGGLAVILIVCGIAGSLSNNTSASLAAASPTASAHPVGNHSTPTATINGTPTATPKPTATSAPAPTDTPLGGPALTITVTCSDATDYAGGEVCVHTAPGASLSIIVTYCSGRAAKSSSLGNATADTQGNHRWTWVPDTICRGQATADVSSIFGTQSGDNSTTFNVN
jgi:hypothetical protein